MRIIWVDDDAFEMLSVLVSRFKRRGIIVERFKFFEDAAEFIKRDIRSTDAFLIDFILPSREVKVAPFLGLDVAEVALKVGVKNITFLSVVGIDQVRRDLLDFKKSHPEFEYKYFNKADIVDSFDELVKVLQTPKQI